MTDIDAFKRDTPVHDRALIVNTSIEGAAFAEDSESYLTWSSSEGDRVSSRIVNLKKQVARLRATGVECSLAQTIEGEYEHIALTYALPGRDVQTLRSGWRTSEIDNQCITLTWLMLDVMALITEVTPDLGRPTAR